jgi:hypothetical protein
MLGLDRGFPASWSLGVANVNPEADRGVGFSVICRNRVIMRGAVHDLIQERLGFASSGHPVQTHLGFDNMQDDGGGGETCREARPKRTQAPCRNEPNLSCRNEADFDAGTNPIGESERSRFRHRNEPNFPAGTNPIRKMPSGSSRGCRSKEGGCGIHWAWMVGLIVSRGRPARWMISSERSQFARRDEPN